MRTHRFGRLLLLTVLLFLLPAGASAGEPGSLTGLWVLSEQRYEGGGAGLAPVDPPLRLGVERSAAGLVVSVRRGELHFPWPSLVTEDGVVPITVLERGADPGGERLRVLWRAEPEGDGRSAMEVEQVLTTGPEDTLQETVRVSLFLDGAPRGGYTLTRRYEREGGRP